MLMADQKCTSYILLLLNNIISCQVIYDPRIYECNLSNCVYTLLISLIYAVFR